VSDYATNRRRSLRQGKGGKPYIIGLSHLDTYFRGWRAMAITSDALRAYVLKRQETKASNSTINRELSLLRRMFALAVEDGKLRHSPNFPMLREAPPRKGFLAHEGYRKMRDELPEYLRPILAMGCYTGMRLGKILALEWANVDLREKEIRLDPGTTKNDEPRTIPLFGELLELLVIERERDPGSERVFARAGERIGSFYKAWKSAAKRAGLGGLLFHDLRRTGVRSLVRAGVPERVAMRISGHKTRDVFERYNITSKRDIEDAAKKLEAYHARNGDNSATIQPPAEPAAPSAIPN
jgi:integrase